MPDKQKKTALITGITGQDGAYLSELLLSKGYQVHGLRRRVSLPNTDRISHLLDKGLTLHYGDMTDTSNIIRLVSEIQPDEIYNLAAQSHFHISFDTPEYTSNADGIGVLRVLEAMRILGLQNTTRFFQASTSELFGKVVETPQTENTPFYPRSPYGVAKLYAYWMVRNYREAYGMFASNAIMFNHESPLRGDDFVTRKVTLSAARVSLGMAECLYIGNLDAKRDWGHARDYMDGVWKILQHNEPDDFILATGKNYTVRQLIEQAFSEVGITLEWSGIGVDEVGCNVSNGNIVVRVDPTHFRPTEVDVLCGDATKAKEKLGWQPTTHFHDLIKEMVASDLERVRK